MRKLTALTVALSLSAAGQAFAGEPHAPAAHAPAAPAARAEVKTEVTNNVKTESPLERQMHRQEIVTQAGTSALSIANSRPQSVLKELGK